MKRTHWLFVKGSPCNANIRVCRQIYFIPAPFYMLLLTDTQSYGREGTADPTLHTQSRTCWIKNTHKHTQWTLLHIDAWYINACTDTWIHTRLVSSLPHTLDSHSARLGEDVCVDVHHEVPPRRVLHHKTHVLRRLETCEQVDEEGVVRAGHRLKDPLLTHQAEETQGRGRGYCSEMLLWDSWDCWRSLRDLLPLHFIPRYDVSLLQSFDGIQRACLFVLWQQHLGRFLIE